MKPNNRRIIASLARRLLALFAIAALIPVPPGRAADNNVAERVKACFEGPANEAAGKRSGNDDLTRSMAEMAAGKLCAKTAADIIQTCLGEINAAEGDDGVKDYYPCIGIVANPCIDSEWAKNEFRSVVCVGTEEQVWLDILHEKLDGLRAALDENPKQRLEATQKVFFEYRNEKCGLMRKLHEGNMPDLAYGACTTETAARFAIDLLDMMEAVDMNGQAADEEETRDEKAQGGNGQAFEHSVTPDTKAAVLGSKSAPVRADNPGGEKAYLRRLRCPDGSAPSFGRRGSYGYGGYGHIVDLYWVRCEETGESYEIYMDMYHPGFVESRPVPGFTLAEE